jgi:hypothetical protein
MKKIYIIGKPVLKEFLEVSGLSSRLSNHASACKACGQISFKKVTRNSIFSALIENLCFKNSKYSPNLLISIIGIVAGFLVQNALK